MFFFCHLIGVSAFFTLLFIVILRCALHFGDILYLVIENTKHLIFHTFCSYSCFISHEIRCDRIILEFIFLKQLTHTLRKQVLSSTYFWCFRLSQTEDSIQHLEGSNGIWKDHDRHIGVQIPFGPSRYSIESSICDYLEHQKRCSEVLFFLECMFKFRGNASVFF